MEENKKQEKTKKEAAQKQAADTKTKVPEPAKPSPGPLHHPTTSVTLPQASHPPSYSSSVRTNGKRAPPSTQQTPQQLTPPPPSSSSGPRYPPREVPPRFRQQEHKQLLKRGQPLPAGALSSLTVTPASDPLIPGVPASSSSAGKRHTDLPFQSGPGAQYENPHWGALPPATDRSNTTTSSSWDQVIIDGSDTEAWPSISRSSVSRPANPPECATAADCTNPETSSNMSMAAGATSQQAHYPSSLKANVANVASMMQPSGGQGVGAIGSRGWGSGPGPITMGPTEGAKPDGLGPNMGRSGGAPSWNSQPSFSLNLNPNANPSAWPVLGQEGAGGGPNPASLPPNGSLGGDENNSSSTWGGMMSPDAPSSNKNVSFSSMEHPNLNTDGQNSHHTKQPLSPIHGLPGWGGQSPTESSQLNGDSGSSVWGNGDTKTSADSSSKNSGWDSAPSGGMSGWGHSGSGGGGSGSGEGGWGGDWGKHSSGGGEVKGGWDSSDGPAQDQQVSSWGQPTPAPASEGSGSGGSEGRIHRRDQTGSEDGGPPSLPRQDLDPRVLCNTGWGQTPVRQHTSWEMEEQRVANERKTSEMRGGGGGDTWRGSNSPSSGSPPDPRNGGANPNLGPSQRPGSGGSGGKSEGPSGWGGPPPSGWGEQPVNKAPNGSVSGWGDPMAQGPNTTNNGPKSGGQSWGVPEEKSSPTWDDGPAKTQQNQTQSWGEGPKSSSHGWGSGHGSGSNGSNGSNGGEWREPAEVKKNGSSSHMWEGEGGNGRGGWKDSPRGGGGNGGGWGLKPAPAVGVGGWGETQTQHPNGPAPGWGSKPQESPSGPAPGWGSKPHESPSGPAPGWGSKPQESPSGPAPGWGSKPQESPSGPAPGWGSKPQESPSGPAPGWGSKPQEGPNGPAPGWGSKPQESPNGPSPGWGSKPQESPDCNNGGGGPGGGSMGSWGGPASVRQSSNPGWGPGSSGAKPDPAMEPTGWEEPSPPSIRRKMEIDDGTSTWGDPSAYNKTVNMWDRNNPTGGNGSQGNNPTQPPISKSSGCLTVNNSHNNHSSVPPSNNNHHHMNHHHLHHGQPPPHSQHHGNNNGSANTAAPHQGGGPQGRPPMANPGWGELPSVQQPKPEPAWGEPAGPSPAVDNGTSAWGKPPGVPGGWGDGGHEPNGPYRRGNNGPSGPAPCKPALKSMQDGWGGGREEEMGMSSGQWDADAGDMWNSPASQENSTSCNSWGQPPKKGPPKGKMGNQPDEAWIMNRLIKQLTDMGFPRDPAEEALKSNNMNLDQAMSALLEKKTELDKRGMGMSDYNNGMNKPLGCRPQALSKDPSSDRSPFLDKDGGLSDDAPPSPFLPSPVSLKLPLVNNLQPGLALGSPGLNMQNLNNRQMQSGMLGSSGAALSRAMQQPPPQPSVPPLGSSQPSLRAQVPQFLTPQVQAQLLQFAAKNIGLNPALLTSPINPQQMTLLYQLQQLQMAYQRLQIQQQMMQAQRNVSGPIRQQEQQVARTINNMQQQIQQHQRQLYQALLMKQQPPGSHSSSGLHPGQGKSALDSFPGHPQAPGLSDLHTKEPHSSPSSYSPYPLSGLNLNMNVNCMEVGGLSMKEPPQPQSRLSQWTHPNSMDSLSGNSSHMEANLNKHGAISAASNLGPPGKPPHMDDSYSPYSMMGGSESPTSPLVPPDSWGQGPGKSPKDQITNGTNINWPPEFCPGVPWKGLQNIDPENDPNMTPGSVPSGPTINTNIQDVNRYLLRDRSGGKLSDMKSTWSPGPISHPSQASLSHELWKVPQGPRNNTAPSRPPPGLTNPTKPSSTWGGNSLGLAQGWSSSYTSEGTTWSTDSSNRTSSWLVLRNLTPQIDGSTLRTLCMQHGPLITFHLFLTQGNAVVRYSSKEEAAKAQKSLHMCVLGNTTILAEFAGEEEVNRYFAQGQQQQQLPPTTSWQPNPGTNQTRMGGGSQQHAIGHHWSSGGLGGGAKTGGGGDLLWGGVPQYSSLWGPPSVDDSRGVIGSPNPINTLLPGDLLSGESM
ncbi:trinucleotide repeat-containing gene 6C protein-like isoform X1 [Salvelinus fontinalis]|uniref:trinucleotide repeat-containing gene 6C protein-like isoform X1 n=1 Tax=Salvelinus fontinalis TaxID=8038 RepID=UPI0024855AE5|nr:trinucleotide repeat-containing gene 6C protein-like isoform X1 [Salvelinus fontinalis]XP_055758879.1 trinucleotide repeat-containing gene 6C protein-like isoform X1 [Salvelinus fontinalis]